jgi:hypothetical protein
MPSIVTLASEKVEEVVNRLSSEGKAIAASTWEFLTFHIGEREVAMVEKMVL